MNHDVKQKPKKQTMNGYSTKYALTRGISKVKIDLDYGDPSRSDASITDGMYVYTEGPWRIQMIVGKTFFENIHDAERKAREQAQRKVKALEKQLAAMRKLAVEPKMDK